MKQGTPYPKSAQLYIARLEKQLEQKDKKIQTLESQNFILNEKLKLALYRKYCKSSEQDKGQQSLFAPEWLSDDPEEIKGKETDVQTVRSYKRRGTKAGRKALADSLPRVEKVIDISEEEKQCACGHTLEKIGEETSEHLVVIPEQVYVERIVRPKYACHYCEGSGDEEHKAVRTSPAPKTLIRGSIAGPELLAFIFTNKFSRYQPYYRQEIHFSEIGAAVSRQDMSFWQMKAGKAVAPLLDLLKKELKSGPVMHMDETGVTVLHEDAKGGEKCKGYMWAATGGRQGKKVCMYEYHPGRSGSYADSYLEGYAGWLQTDGYKGYACVEEKHPGVHHALCLAHARRRFVDALKANHKNVFLSQVLRILEKIYGAEKTLRKQNLEPAVFIKTRKNLCAPFFNSLKELLDSVPEEQLYSPAIHDAVSYMRNNWEGLTVYLECPDLTPDNNECENAIRPFVIGRKNWLFSGSSEGAESSCALFSLIETAKSNGLKPYEYLREIFSAVPLFSTPEQWASLLPWHNKFCSVCKI